MFDPDTVIRKIIARSSYTHGYKDGRLILRRDTLSADMRHLRIDYTAGESSVPATVAELSATIAGIACLARMIGGSFDDMASYAMGEVQVGKGEPYPNLRAAIRELEMKRDKLWAHLGSGVKFYAT